MLYENGLDVNYNELERLHADVASFPPQPEIEKIQQLLQTSQTLEGALKCLKETYETAVGKCVQNEKQLQ